MIELRAALIAEGKADDGLVDVLSRLCLRKGVSVGIESVRDQLERHAIGRGVEAKVRAVVELGDDFDILFIHRDSDKHGPEARRIEISTACDINGVQSYVPVVPIRATEAWLLVDADVIRSVVGNPGSGQPLDLPKLRDVEETTDPKQRLRTVLDEARRRQRHKRKHRAMSKSEFSQYRRKLLEQLDIDGPVRQLSAWQALERDLTRALAQLDPAHLSP